MSHEVLARGNVKYFRPDAVTKPRQEDSYDEYLLQQNRNHIAVFSPARSDII